MEIDTLFQQLLRDPSPEHLRVYADLAQENGEPHGELIALQCARELSSEAPSRREHELISQLDRELATRLGTLKAQPFWRRGFVDRLRLTLDEAGVNLAPLSGPRALALLRHVDLELASADQLGDLSALWARFPRLTSVESLRASGLLEGVLSPSIGRVAPLATALPSLRELQLHGLEHDLEALVFPNLTFFAASRLNASTIPALVHARWPKLEVLELEFGAARPDEIEPLFGPLLDTRMSESLRRVTVKSPWPEFFAAALPRSLLGRGREVSV